MSTFVNDTNKSVYSKRNKQSAGNALDTSGSRSEIPGRFGNVVLEMDGKDQLDRSCEK